MKTRKRNRRRTRRMFAERLEDRRLLAAAPHPFDLSTLDGDNGFQIQGASSGDTVVRTLSDAGDINGDGLGDLITQTFGVNDAFVVFGNSSGVGADFDLSTLDGSNGFRVNGPVDSGVGKSVSSAGDVNGDGYDDLVLGATHYPDDTGVGAAYVVFGKASGFGASIGLATLNGDDGFRLDGVVTGDHAGHSVSGAGDFNHDGFDDLIIGAPYAQPNGLKDAGSNYVLFGRPRFSTNVDLAALNGENGFRLDGANKWDETGSSVSRGGDINGDGFDDILIAAPGADSDPNLSLSNGKVYVVFGGDYGAYVPGVTAALVNGQLTITGDETANHIRLTIDAAGNALVDGLRSTTVNGLASASFSGITATNDVIVSMAGGNDSVVVRLDGASLRFFGIETGKGKDFVDVDESGSRLLVQEILTGNGADHIIVSNLPGSGLDIDSGKGSDRVELRGTVMASLSRIRLGAGDDVLQGFTEGAFPVSADVDGGTGVDLIIMPNEIFQITYKNFEEVIRWSDQTSSVVGGNITTEVIADPKIGNILVIKGKDHFDHDLRLSSTELGQVTIESTGYDATIDGVASSVSFDNIARVKVITGSGTDNVLAEGLLLSDKLIVNTGLGDDNVQVVGSQLKKLKINTGGGDDTVLIDATTVNRRTKVVTGWGEDDVTIRDSIFGRKVTLESGPDDDILHLLGVNLFNKGLDDDFEQVL